MKIKWKKSDGAVSEVIGAILMVGIGVALFSILYFIVMSYPFTPSVPSVDIVGSIEGSNIVLEHRGGDSLDQNATVSFTVGGTRISNTVGFFLNDSNGNHRWDIGEQLVYHYNSSMTNLQVEVTVIDTDSNSIMMMGVLQEGETTIIPPLNPSLNTSVNPISPYVQASPSLTVNATGDSGLDNVTLYYRWSDDNISWNGGSYEIYDGVDSNTSNVDGSGDKGTETNFANANGTVPDGNSMSLEEADQAGQSYKTAVQGDTTNVDLSADLGTETNFVNCKETAPDGDNMSLAEADQAGQSYKTAVQGDTTDVDLSADLGTETNFANCKETAPDGDNMSLVEVSYGILNENKTVNGWDSIYTAWTEVGDTNAYLCINTDDDSKYITSGTQSQREGWFSFADTTTTSGTITATIYVNAWRDTSGDGDDYADIFVDYSGGSGIDFGDVCTSTSSNAVQSISVGSLTVTQANALRVYFIAQKTGPKMDNLFIDYVYVWFHRDNTTNYRLDFEFNWSTAHFSETTKTLCFYVQGHTGGSENLFVKYWTGSWTSLGTISSTGWTNITATGLTSGTYTIRLNGSKASGDTVKDTWYIDCIFLHTYNASNYRLDFEYQWTAAVYNWVNKQVCIYVTNHTGGTENLLVNYWNGSTWSSLGTITTTGWLNFTATGLTSSTYTIQLKGATESGDTVKDIWNIDVILLHTWNTTGGLHGQNWIIWPNVLNPDLNSPWSWNFNFSKGAGYYEFYSMGMYAGTVEGAPASADSRCRHT